MAAGRKDPYATLGVPRTSDEGAIKKAYRALAQRYHPDRNQDDEDAEERFKEISAAYSVLSDAKRRKAYDEYGDIALDPNFDPSSFRQQRGGSPFGGQGFDSSHNRAGGQGGGFGNIFDEFFGNDSGGFARGRGPRRAKGSDLETSVRLQLLEASKGCERSISIKRSGTPEVLRVQIPPGTKGGARIRLAGKGNPGTAGGPPGDLFCRILLAPHPHFRVEEYDLHLDVPIGLSEAILGAEVEIPTLEGRVTLSVRPGTDAGTRLRLRGKGIQRPGDEAAGDLYVTLVIRVPKDLDDAGRAAVEELATYGPDDLRTHLFSDEASTDKK
jgi:DnaJ-class molecular chaperone